MKTLHSIAAKQALGQRNRGKKIKPEEALRILKEMGFFRSPMAIHVSRALRYAYG